ncbi:hypothetical protein [Burkholderia ambifaria]|uniref:hypothetical protein n=1 Tax=Burkholderia ambifaria TaxID=152480 RepID=UPI003C7A7365
MGFHVGRQRSGTADFQDNSAHVVHFCIGCELILTSSVCQQVYIEFALRTEPDGEPWLIARDVVGTDNYCGYEKQRSSVTRLGFGRMMGRMMGQKNKKPRKSIDFAGLSH